MLVPLHLPTQEFLHVERQDILHDVLHDVLQLVKQLVLQVFLQFPLHVRLQLPLQPPLQEVLQLLKHPALHVPKQPAHFAAFEIIYFFDGIIDVYFLL